MSSATAMDTIPALNNAENYGPYDSFSLTDSKGNKVNFVFTTAQLTTDLPYSRSDLYKALHQLRGDNKKYKCNQCAQNLYEMINLKFPTDVSFDGLEPINRLLDFSSKNIV